MAERIVRTNARFQTGDRVIYMGRAETVGTVESCVYDTVYVKRDGWVRSSPFAASDLSLVHGERSEK